MPTRYRWWRVIALGCTSPIWFFAGGFLSLEPLAYTIETGTLSRALAPQFGLGLLGMLIGLIVIFGIPLGTYLDTRFLADNDDTEPVFAPFSVVVINGFTIPIAPLALGWGCYYLWRRHRTIGTP